MQKQIDDQCRQQCAEAQRDDYIFQVIPNVCRVVSRDDETHVFGEKLLDSFELLLHAVGCFERVAITGLLDGQRDGVLTVKRTFHGFFDRRIADISDVSEAHGAAGICAAARAVRSRRTAGEAGRSAAGKDNP